MKKEISLFLVCLMLTACGNQKKKVSNKNNCKVIAAPSEELTSNYKSFFTSSSDFNRKQLTDFDAVKNGVLLYKWQEPLTKGVFLIVNFDKGFMASKKMEDFNKNVNFTLKDKSELERIVKRLKKESYYQNCEFSDGHSSMYLLVIRQNNEKLVQYYSPFCSPYGIITLDSNVQLIQKVFDIMDRNYYK